MARSLTFYVNIALALVVLSTLVFAFPYALSAWYLYQGAAAYEKAMMSEGLDLGAWNTPTVSASGTTGSDQTLQLLAKAQGDLLRAVRWDANNQLAYLSLSKAYFFFGDHLSAAKALMQNSAFQSARELPQIDLLEVYKAAGGREKALAEWRTMQGAEEFLMRQGDLQLENDHVDQAWEAYSAALEIDPDLGPPHYQLGNIYRRRSDWDNAVREYETAVSIDPRNAEYVVSLGEAYLQQGLYSQAIEQFKDGVSLRPQHVRSHAWLALAYFRTGSYEEAIEEVQEAIRLEPANETFVLLLAEIYREAELEAEAIAQYEKVLELNPGNIQALERLEDLRK